MFTSLLESGLGAGGVMARRSRFLESSRENVRGGSLEVLAVGFGEPDIICSRPKSNRGVRAINAANWNGGTMARKKVERTVEDVRKYPSYSIDEVAAYIGVPKRTLRSWVSGYKYKNHGQVCQAAPVIEPANQKHLLLSFFNLVEAQVLAATRERRIGVGKVRRAIEFLREVTGVDRPLLRCVFATHGSSLFVESIDGKKLKNPLDVSRYGQYVFGKMLKRYLERIERDTSGLPTILYPMKAGQATRAKVITIRPYVSAGKPSLKKSGVMAEVIWMRRREGEKIASLARDFRLKPSEIKAAITYFAA